MDEGAGEAELLLHPPDRLPARRSGMGKVAEAQEPLDPGRPFLFRHTVKVGVETGCSL